MNVDSIFKLMLFAIKKNQNGNLTPDSFNLIINSAQKQWVAYMLGNFQTYQPGRPIARVELGNNQTVRQRLTPVIYGYVLDINSSGLSPYPGDFIQADAMYSIYGINKIRYVQQDQLADVYNSVIDPIASNPIYLIKDVGFQFYPTTTWQAKLSYVRNPPGIVWAYTLDVNNRQVYDPVNSIDPIFDDITVYEIIVRALALVGVNLQLGVVLQYANDIKKTGE